MFLENVRTFLDVVFPTLTKQTILPIIKSDAQLRTEQFVPNACCKLCSLCSCPSINTHGSHIAIAQDSYLKWTLRTLQCFAHCMYAKKYGSFRDRFKSTSHGN